jgi:hypothetical protein
MPLQIVKLIGQPTPVIVTGGFVPRGAYNAETDYAVGDSVDYLGSSYVMFNDAGAGTVPTNTTYWQVLANKGATGTTGDTGETGATGSDGEGLVGGWIYFPNYAARNTDGSYRVGINEGNLVIQKLISSNWIELGVF